MFVVGVFGYAALAPSPASRPARFATGASASPSPTGPPPAYDVRPLAQPQGRYLGVALSGAPQDMSRVDRFADLVGSKPNIITIYESFDDEFAAAEVRRVHRYGALPIIRWEPFKAKLADIAAGRHDPYLRAVRHRGAAAQPAGRAHHRARDERPLVFLGHADNTARDFVAAWRHIHAVFAQRRRDERDLDLDPERGQPGPVGEARPALPR